MANLYIPLLIEANGKTIRQNNMEKQHAIPLGSLVEINLDYHDNHGMRMRVVGHDRDCDGTPLYSLSFLTLESIERYRKLGINEIVLNMAFTGAFSDECLIVIKSA
jgi:hypothetical protein